MLSVRLPHLLILFTGNDAYGIKQDWDGRIAKKDINNMFFLPFLKLTVSINTPKWHKHEYLLRKLPEIISGTPFTFSFWKYTDESFLA